MRTETRSDHTEQEWAGICKQALIQAFGEEAREYIDEAEHQDGEGYWQYFDNLYQVRADYRLYLESIE